jgi:hypothetical protein
MSLFKRGFSKIEIEQKLAKFFNAYDKSRDDRVLSMQKKLEYEKKINYRLRSA